MTTHEKELEVNYKGYSMKLDLKGLNSDDPNFLVEALKRIFEQDVVAIKSYDSDLKVNGESVVDKNAAINPEGVEERLKEGLAFISSVQKDIKENTKKAKAKRKEAKKAKAAKAKEPTKMPPKRVAKTQPDTEPSGRKLPQGKENKFSKVINTNNGSQMEKLNARRNLLTSIGKTLPIIEG